MPATRALPYGGWPSAITADMITAGNNSRNSPCKIGNIVYWQETRPGEKGRTTIVAYDNNGQTRDLLPFPLSTQSKVHEYGGKSWLVDGTDLFYVDKDDQRIYHHRLATNDGPFESAPLTPEGEGLRFADFCLDRQHNRLISVCEIHSPALAEPANVLAAIPLDGSGCEIEKLEILASGSDFYAYPRLSPNGEYLSWMVWHHPQMPWDGTELFLAKLDQLGGLDTVRVIAGSTAESIFQPAWSPDNRLFFVSDRSGWWNLYATDEGGKVTAIYPLEAEFGTPLWSLGMSTYDFVSANKIAALHTKSGSWRLGLVDVKTGTMETLNSPCADMSGIHCSEAGDILFTGSTAVSTGDIFYIRAGKDDVVSLTDSTPDISLANISRPTPLSFPTADDEHAHGFYYPPANAEYEGEADSLPPLIVMCHGGPTGASYGVLAYKIQYWTSRGFALLDVNYRGSTGYGRAYREKINGRWGQVDVDDAANGAKYLAAQNLIDPDKVIIRGGSAGGFTVLAALAFTDAFKVGASLYGIGDLEALARDTHKFESRYTDNLVGPYPQSREIYQQRSPISHLEKFDCPVIFLQGLEDKVVPPNQAEAMVAALDNKGIPVAYVTFADEGHGFRKADNIKTALESELYFYRAVLGIPSPEKLPVISIRNMD